jgi:hypothetical protein
MSTPTSPSNIQVRAELASLLARVIYRTLVHSRATQCTVIPPDSSPACLASSSTTLQQCPDDNLVNTTGEQGEPE